MTALFFEENQTFRQPWLWGLMLAVLAGLLFALVTAQEGQIVLLAVLGLQLATCLFLLSLRMTVQVETDFLRIRFFPIWTKTIPLTEIVQWEARRYRPIREYGGWGIRYSWSKGWAYNVSGNQGVQLELANGQRILIGSQRAEELARAIEDGKGD